MTDLSTPSLFRLRGHLVPVLFAVVMCFSHLGQGSLAVDAIRYADISKQLSEHVPFSQVKDGYRGTNYVNKPPLLFKLTAQSFRVLGRNTFTAKLPAVSFVFLSLLLFYWLARKESGAAAGYWAIGLVAANRSFARDLVDFSFEGIALFGTLLCLAGVLRLISNEEQSPGRTSVILGAGIFVLVQSKLPYFLFVFVPLAALLLLRIKDTIWLWPRVFRFNFLAPLVALTLLGGLSYLFAGTDSRTHAFNNQLIEPFNMHHGYWVNLLKWSRSLFLTQAPLSWVTLIAAFTLLKKKERTNTELLLLLWCAQALPMTLLVANRPRYLWPPLAAGVLLSADYLARRMPIRELQLKIAMLAASVLVLLLVISGVRIHRENPFVDLLKRTSVRHPLPLCVGGETPEDARRAVQQTKLLLEFEFDRELTVLSPADVPAEVDLLFADRLCREALGWGGTELSRGTFVLKRLEPSAPPGDKSAPPRLLSQIFQMGVPGERHEDVRADEKKYCS